VQLQRELREPLAEVGEELTRIALMLKPDDEVVREAHDDHIAACLSTSPLPGPPVEDVVEVDVGKQGRS
jgi:hypothetical protein